MLVCFILALVMYGGHVGVLYFSFGCDAWSTCVGVLYFSFGYVRWTCWCALF